MIHEITGFEHLHLHTDRSLLDGYGKPEEYAARAKKINQQFLCVTDHGMMAAVPTQLKVCENNKLNHIFGIELYVNPYQMEVPHGEKVAEHIKKLNMSDEEKAKFKKSYHLLALAYNYEGYKNLVKLSSWGWVHGHYYRPRVNHEQLIKHKEGIFFTSCCYNSEIGQAFDREGEEAAEAMLLKYVTMFGDKFFLEIMLLDFSKQKPYDKFIIKMHLKYHIPIIVTNDVHYCEQADSHMQQLMLMIQTKRTLPELEKMKKDDDGKDLFELQDKNLWMKSEDEINYKWETDYSDIIDYEIFKQAKRNTVEIANKCKNVQLDRSMKLPKFPDEDEKLKEAILKGIQERNIPKNKDYMLRIMDEYNLIKQKGFSSYFLLQKMMIEEAKRKTPEILGIQDNSLVTGPARGSVGGCLVAYALGIIDVDPVYHDLMFSRFMSPARGGKQMKIRFSGNPIKILENKIDFEQGLDVE